MTDDDLLALAKHHGAVWPDPAECELTRDQLLALMRACMVRGATGTLRWATEEAGSAEAAIKTLQRLGYTYHGAELWKPPLGESRDAIVASIMEAADEYAKEHALVGLACGKMLGLAPTMRARSDAASAELERVVREELR